MWWTEYNTLLIILACVALAAAAGQIGTFAFLRKRALVGDVVAHSVLPGLCVSFMVIQYKHPMVLMVGSVATGWASLLLTDWITKHTKLKEDTALGVVLSFFFATGLLLLSRIQHSGNASQAGLDHYLFGKAATMTEADAMATITVALVTIAVIWTLLNRLRMFTFHKEYAATMGHNVKLLELTLSILSVSIVAIGIQSVGVVLIAALLIAPATAARFWTNRLTTMLVVASIVGMIAAIGAVMVSLRWNQVPTGPWMVLFLGVLVFISGTLAPKRGILKQYLLQRRHSRKMLFENVLKAIYGTLEKQGDITGKVNEVELIRRQALAGGQLEKGLSVLRSKKMVSGTGGWWSLTELGLQEASRVVRLHRLWELYLTNKLRLPQDHVHQNAEAIEHVLTPEIEAALTKELDFPESDPHNQQIPYQQ